MLYGGRESYHHMCRYFSGFFYKHPLLKEFDYYWRMEPDVHYYCDLDYDPFLFMQASKAGHNLPIVSLTMLKRTHACLRQQTVVMALQLPKNFFSNSKQYFDLELNLSLVCILLMSSATQDSQHKSCAFRGLGFQERFF